MNDTHNVTRRSLLGAAAASGLAAAAPMLRAQEPSQPKLKGRIRQAVSRWCFGGMTLEELCRASKGMGIVGIDLLGENEWDAVKQHGLVCSMCSGVGSIPDGWNRVENHDRLTRDAERLIPLVAKSGYRNLITFSGNRRGISDSEGLANCAKGLRRITKVAEDHGVTVCMELLSSKRSHRDYQCDHTLWGVELAKQVGSPRFKLLYDVFHMQIMEGDICDTVREHIQHVGHFHTGGVPGRNEIDTGQEINYARVCKTIADLKFEGFVAHEFVPTRSPLESLREAVRICDV